LVLHSIPDHDQREFESWPTPQFYRAGWRSSVPSVNKQLRQRIAEQLGIRATKYTPSACTGAPLAVKLCACLSPVHIAAIDAGSNAVAFTVARAYSALDIEPLLNERYSLRLGEGVFPAPSF